MPRASTTINTHLFSPTSSSLSIIPTDETPTIISSITITQSRSLSSIPKNPIETIMPASTTPTFTWVDNHGIHHPFPIVNDSNKPIDVIEYQTTGTLMTSFLNADAKSHTVKLTLANADIERIKDLVKTSPNFIEQNFHWPFDINGIATFTSKENSNIFTTQEGRIRTISTRGPAALRTPRLGLIGAQEMLT